MARFTGSRLKVVRRFGHQMPGLTRKSAEQKPYPPGQHGPNMRRAKPSDYRVRLDEKQRLRMNYGLSERQLRKYFRLSVAARGDTGQNLLQMLESRLDNVVFRGGFAPTTPAARQLVGHGHVLVNGKKLDIPSYIVQEGDVITLRDKSKQIPVVVDTFSAPSLEIPSYLSRNDGDMSVTFTATPTRDDVPLDLQEHLIIEHYSRVA